MADVNPAEVSAILKEQLSGFEANFAIKNNNTKKTMVCQKNNPNSGLIKSIIYSIIVNSHQF